MFITDRDLLTFEPNLFRDAGAAGQRLIRATGSIAGTTLTLATYDVDLADADIAAGHVALVDGTPYEVIERLSPTTATLSRLRVYTADPILPPSPATSKPVDIYTFRPQIAQVHAQILRMLGIEPEDLPIPGRVTEDDILNPGALTMVEALGAIYQVYTAADGLTFSPNSSNFQRARIFADRYQHARDSAYALIDLDGDGLPDSTRRLNCKQLIRA